MAKETQERRVVGYLKPCNETFIKGYAEVQGISNSAALNDAAKALKACQPPEILAKILNKVT